MLKHIVSITVFVMLLSGLKGQTLVGFSFSDCMKECIGDSSSIDEISVSAGVTTIKLTDYAPCNGNFEATVAMEGDTLMLNYYPKPTAVVNKKTGEVTGLLEVADCVCVFKLLFKIRGLPAVDRNKIHINGDPLIRIQARQAESGEIQVIFDNDSIR